MVWKRNYKGGKIMNKWNKLKNILDREIKYSYECLEGSVKDGDWQSAYEYHIESRTLEEIRTLMEKVNK